MTHHELNNILGHAGLLMTEAADIFHISRATLYRWLDGGGHESTYLWENAVQTAGKLQAAILTGELPLSSDIKRADRLRIINVILNRH